MTSRTKAAQKTAGRKAATKPARKAAGRKFANDVGVAKPPRTTPRPPKPSLVPAAARAQLPAEPDAAAQPEWGVAAAPSLATALAALLEYREAFGRASAEFGTQLAGLAQVQLAAQIEAAQGLASTPDPARAAEIHRNFLHGTAERAAEGAAGWRAAMALWLDGAAALWGGFSTGGTTRKELR